MAKPEFLMVLPNPWTYIDEYGSPAGFVLHDPEIIPPTQRRMVGAEIASADLMVGAGTPHGGMGVGIGRAPRHRVRLRYSAEPVKVNNTRYYQNEVKAGNLIAADKFTAVACRVTKFVKPATFIERLRKLAIAEYKATNPDLPDASDPLTTAPEPAPPAAPAPNADPSAGISSVSAQSNDSSITS